ncbi:hypothetical protein N0V86_003480 [Didymella sp. IMI 355093]|nr:hypothetical protein N0V86_003480 [Didymella sp. IMI 355093]
MEPSTPRLSTPRPLTPPPTGLLTPPSTGGSRKRAQFEEPQESHVSSKRQNKIQFHRGEFLDEFFQDHNEGEEVQIEHESTTSSLSYFGESFASSVSAPLATTFFDEAKAQAVTTNIIAPTSPPGPFPFLKLPLSIRDKIYGHLLIVPALIRARQKHTAFHNEQKAFLYAERRELLPGIAYALTQSKVDGFKSRFSRFPNTNLSILRVSKEVFLEARMIMYSKNEFDIVKPSSELAPEPDYSVPLFPPGYQRLVTKLNMRIRTFYDLDWLLGGGYNVIKNYYRGLDILTLVLEIDSATRGYGRRWSRKTNEKWTDHIKRLRDDLGKDLFEVSKSKRAASIPAWIDLRVLFSGESYVGSSPAPVDTIGVAVASTVKSEQVQRDELKRALTETFELFKKSGK